MNNLPEQQSRFYTSSSAINGYNIYEKGYNDKSGIKQKNVLTLGNNHDIIGYATYKYKIIAWRLK